LFNVASATLRRALRLRRSAFCVVVLSSADCEFSGGSPAIYTTDLRRLPVSGRNHKNEPTSELRRRANTAAASAIRLTGAVSQLEKNG
jgi:hypothetical protein